jgi:hypothetical protein
LPNPADRNYRIHGSAVVAPGFNTTASLRYRF